MAENQTKTDTPLSHITVLDLSRVMAGPWATQNLADLGANVIKVERPVSGDDTRKWGPPYLKDKDGKDTSEAAYYLSTNRGKKSVTIDMATKKGQELIKKLAEKCDIVFENFKVGGLKKYGLDYDSLKKVNPKLIYCSITGFGQDGPYSHHAGYDYMIQAMGGLMSVTGEADGEPMKVGVPITDIMTGMYSTIAVLAALQAREKTGKGQYIDMALLDVQVAMLANQSSNYLASGKIPQRLGNAHPNIVPYQVFKTKTDPIILAVGNDGQFAKFCELAECEYLARDEKYKTNEARVKNRGSLIPILEKAMITRKSKDWLKELEAAKVPCGPINNIKQVLEHPQVKHRGMEVKLPHPLAGEVSTIKSPMNFSDTPLEYKNAPPTLGSNTEDVLKELLDMDEKEISSLKKEEII